MVGRSLNKLLEMVKMVYMHFRDFCGHWRILKYNPQAKQLERHLLSPLVWVWWNVEGLSVFWVSKYLVYFPSVSYSYCLPSVCFSLFLRMSNEALLDFTGKKASCTHQKYCSFVFCIFFSLRPMFLQLLFFQVRGEIRLNSLFKTANGYPSTFPSGGGQVSQSVFRATVAKLFYSCVSCSFLLSPEACRHAVLLG